MGLIRVDLSKCERDGTCVEVCPISILTMDEQEGPQVIGGMAQHCIGCGHCVAACPHGALDNVRNPLAQQGLLPHYPAVEAQTALTFLRSRRSIRRYRDESVPRGRIAQLLEAARYAPSGHNSQGISYLVVDDPVALKRIIELVVGWMGTLVSYQPELAARLHMPGIIKSHERGEDRILRHAPVLVIASAPKDLLPALITTCLALEYVELYATTLGLGTCWAGYAQVCAQQYAPLIDFLGISQGRMVTGMMMVGYPRYSYYRLPEREALDLAWFE